MLLINNTYCINKMLIVIIIKCYCRVKATESHSFSKRAAGNKSIEDHMHPNLEFDLEQTRM